MVHQDQIYIDRILTGDHQAFSFLVDKYKQMAFNIAFKIVENETDAEDITQESFVKIYRQLHTFEGKSKFSTWLYTVVYRTAVSKLQVNTLDTSPITDELTENYFTESQPSSMRQLELADQRRYVDEAIQRLPKLEGLLITLFYLEENSPKEIQEITGLSAENIRIKLFRARKKLELRLRFLL